MDIDEKWMHDIIESRAFIFAQPEAVTHCLSAQLHRSVSTNRANLHQQDHIHIHLAQAVRQISLDFILLTYRSFCTLIFLGASAGAAD